MLHETTAPIAQKKHSAKRYAKLARIGTAGVMLMAFIIAPWLKPAQVQAFTEGNQSLCGGSVPGTWKDDIKAISPDYDPDTAPGFLMAKLSSSSQYFTVFILNGVHTAQFVYDSTATPAKKILVKQTAHHMQSNPALGPQSSQFRVHENTGAVTAIGQVPANGPSPYGGPGTAPSEVSNVVCVRAAKGFSYEADWPDIQYSTQVPSQGVSTRCEGLDVGCWIGKAFNGIADTFTAVGRAILTGLTLLFIPDSAYMSDKMAEMSDFWSTKLGFLAYPVEYLVSMFSAFTDTSNNWCTETSCTKSFGNLFGGGASINVLALKQLAPTLWTGLLVIIRGATVFGLILAIRAKALGVMTK